MSYLENNMIVKMLKHIVDVTDGPGDDAVWDPIIKRMIPGLIDTLLHKLIYVTNSLKDNQFITPTPFI